MTILTNVTSGFNVVPKGSGLSNSELDNNFYELLSNTKVYGVNSQALHRSGNATALFVYDTSKDSDGGAWTEKCQHTSWYNEPLSGNWLGSCGSELSARHIGATLDVNTLVNSGFDVDASGFELSGGATLTAENGLGKFVSANGTQYATALANFQNPANLVVGALYEASFDVYAGTYAGTVSIAFEGGVASSVESRLGNGFTRYVAYMSSTTFSNGANGRRLRIRFESTHTAGSYIYVDNFTFRRVISRNALSNDYFQLTTDGKFYKLWNNLFKYSNVLTNGIWSGMTVATTTATTAPDGSNTAFLYTETGSVGHTRIQSVSLTFGVTYTVSAYMKNSTRRYGALTSSNFNNYTATFDLQTPSTVASAGATSTITSVGNGWYLCTLTFVANTTASSSIGIGSNNSNSGSIATYVLDGNTDLYFWRTQLEIGSTVTTYEDKSADGTITEVFRGNKAKFPKLVGIVAEATSVTLYDLTESSRPMWMRFIQGTGYMLGASAGGLSVPALNGLMCVASATGFGMQRIDFANDKSSFLTTVGSSFRTNTIAGRNTTGGLVGVAPIIVNATVYSIAMTVLPDAPLDPITGLQVPTIAVGTAGGVTVIRHDGTAVNITGLGTFVGGQNMAFNQYSLLVGRASETYPRFFNAGRDTVAVINGGGNNYWGFLDTKTLSVLSAGNFYGFQSLLGTISFRKFDRSKTISSVTNGLNSNITNIYNTGYLLGDIRRAYLADSVVGSSDSTELVVNGQDWTGASGTTPPTGWTSPLSSIDSTYTISGGVLTITNGTGSSRTVLRQQISVTSGKTYRVSVIGLSVGNSGAGQAVVRIADTDSYADITPVSITANSTTTFIATTSTVWAFVANFNAANNVFISIDSLSIKEVVSDRSYKAANTTIYGTLTKSLTSANNQIVAYSGFSVNNYLQEPYSADLDFGTGEFSVSAWVDIPTDNSSAGVIVDRKFSSGPSITLGVTSSNYLTATAYDGTTTRTATTSVTANTGNPLNVSTVYKNGLLSIYTNGSLSVAASGVPLLSLSNTSAVLTIGNSYALDAPFTGSIALLKLSATAPTQDQITFMYEQEKQMFRDGAQCLLPDAGAVVDLGYDDLTDKWTAISATNESTWTGLVRTNVTPIPVGTGANIKVFSNSGVKLNARSTFAPGVDITFPDISPIEQVYTKAISAAKNKQVIVPFDFDTITFSANTTNISPNLTNVTAVSGTPYIGMGINGAGIPAGAVINYIGSNYYLMSTNATATTGSVISIGQTTYTLNVGYTNKSIYSNGSQKTEGSTKDYVITYDGFRETITFNTTPGVSSWVQIQAGVVT